MAHDNPLRHLTTDNIDTERAQHDQLSDRQLVAHVAELLAAPPTDPADSFVLHAPLELMTRSELLGLVDPAARDQARRRIVEIAAQWNAHHPHLDHPTTPHTVSLHEAIDAGDLDATDTAVVHFAESATVDQFIASAADNLLAHLGGAGHLSIFLDHLDRFPRPPHNAISMSRALVRDVARHPDWKLHWIDQRPPGTHRRVRDFTDVLTNPPSAGDPGNNFIYPTMHLVDASGLAAELLTQPTDTIPLDEARRQLLRIAAMSMLHDDPTNAPYGWSHCLTMPQATLSIAKHTTNPRRAIAIAATYVLGFRATQSTTAIDLDWTPPRPPRRPQTSDLLEADLDTAVSLAWHNEPDEIERELATFAATHHDAHLAKYTLACLYAAHDDPAAAPLYRAAATRLALWWRDNDTTLDTPKDDHDDI